MEAMPVVTTQNTTPYGSHGVAQLIREAGEVPRVRP